MAVVCLTILAFQPSKLRGRQPTSLAKASSVPGRTQTAVLASSGAANPRVPVLKFRVVSLSPTLAGRDFYTVQAVIAHAEDLLCCPPRLSAQPQQETRNSMNRPKKLICC